MNIENLKIIMTEKKTWLPLLRNQGWRTVKAGTEKHNQIIYTYLNEKHLGIK